MSNRNILVCTTTHFPDNDAGSIYYTNIGKCLTDNGDQILFVGNGYGQYKKIIKDNKSGFNYLSLRNSKNNIFSKIISHLLIKRRIISYIFKNSNIDCLVLDGSFSLKQYNKICDFFAKHNPKTKILIGILELYSLDEFENQGIIVRKMVKNNNVFAKKFNNPNSTLIVISSFLENIFKDRNMSCIRVPFIFESSKMITPDEKSSFDRIDNKIRIIYAGNPSKKDLLGNILLGISMLSDDELNKIHVDIVGVNHEWLIRNGINDSLIERVSKTVSIHGHITHDDVENLYKVSDYSILVRDGNKCFAKAGFPTKISESMYYCTVPITNYTSDLAMYLKDGINSIEINGFEPNDIKIAIQNAISNYKNIGELRIESCKTLKNNLSVECYKNTLQQIFIKK